MLHSVISCCGVVCCYDFNIHLNLLPKATLEVVGLVWKSCYVLLLLLHSLAPQKFLFPDSIVLYLPCTYTYYLLPITYPLNGMIQWLTCLPAFSVSVILGVMGWVP